MVIFWQLLIIGTGNWHIDLEMGTLLHVSCAGISRDLRKSSTPSLSGNRSLNTVSVCKLDSAWSSNELQNAVPESCSIVKRHENIGIFEFIFSNRAIRKSQPAKIQNTTWWALNKSNDRKITN
jgi:hypothetical protein